MERAQTNGTVEMTLKQKSALHKATGYQVALAVIEELDRESSKAADNKESPFIFTDKIQVK